MLLDRASSRLEQLAVSRTRQEPVKASADLYHHIEELERRREGGSRAISTGFADVDDKLSGGLRGGELVVLAARPKMGKTAFALNLACNIAQSHSVLVLSMEMPAHPSCMTAISPASAIFRWPTCCSQMR